MPNTHDLEDPGLEVVGAYVYIISRQSGESCDFALLVRPVIQLNLTYRRRCLGSGRVRGDSALMDLSVVANVYEENPAGGGELEAANSKVLSCPLSRKLLLRGRLSASEEARVVASGLRAHPSAHRCFAGVSGVCAGVCCLQLSYFTLLYFKYGRAPVPYFTSIRHRYRYYVSTHIQSHQSHRVRTRAAHRGS